MSISEEKADKEKWYPGKFIKERRKSSLLAVSDSEDQRRESHLSAASNAEGQVKPRPSTDTGAKPISADILNDSNKKSSSWYPGKYAGRKPPVQSSSQPQTFHASPSYPVAGAIPIKTVGTVIIKVIGAKYMSATQPSFEVWVGNQVQHFEFLGLDVSDGSSNEEFECHFPIGDITSDVFILVKEEYSVGATDGNFIGRVVIPLSSYVTPKGSKPATVEWMTIYPIVDNKRPMDMFRSGLHELPGSAMPRSKQSLGFLAVKVQLLLSAGPVYGLYLEGETSQSMPQRLTEPAQGDDASQEVGRPRKFDPEMMYRTYLRLKKILNSSPAAFSPVLRFPEVFILIVLYGFICFGAEAHHLPMICAAVVLINGLLSISEKKNFNDVILWNTLIDPRKGLSGTTVPSDTKHRSIENSKRREFALECLEDPLCSAQEYLERIVGNLESMSNIWNFSDMQVSIVFYGGFLALAAVSSTVIFLFSIRPLAFVVGSLFLLVNSLRDIFPELMSIVPEQKKGENAMKVLRSFTTKFWMLLARVPNDSILEHRYIARTCIVEDGGIEMEDAAQKKTA